MVIEKLRAFVDRHIRKILGLLVGAAVILWLVGRFSPSLAAWIRGQHLLEVIILILVAELVALAVENKQGVGAKTLQLYEDQLDASRHLIEFIEKSRPRSADLVEVSSSTIETVLEALRRVECRIRLLLQHPEAAVTEFQAHRIEQRISDISQVTLRDYEDCEVRLYTVPCSLRGRLFDDKVVNLGWYTYSSSETGVHGHDNPLITAAPDSSEGRRLRRMFVRGFDWLWDHPETIRMEDFLASRGGGTDEKNEESAAG